MPGEWPDQASDAVAAVEAPDPGCLRVALLTDSALVREGNPVFLPGFAQGWMLEVAPYFSIGRLGKSIAPRFAMRYVDGFGLAARLVPPGWRDNSGAGSHAGALAVNFDGALLYGSRFPLVGPDVPGEWVLSCGGNEVAVARADLRLEETVALVSRYMTLKTGDLILPCAFPLAVSAEIGLRAEVMLNGLPALKMKVK